MWFKVSDDLAFHPKTVEAGNEAMGVWVRMGAWSSFARTGGVVPKAMALAIAGDVANLVALERAGFIQCKGESYIFNDWELFNPTADQANELHQIRSDAGKLGAQKRWANHTKKAKAKAGAMAQAKANDIADDVAQGSGTGTGRSSKKKARARPKDWKPNEAAQRFAGKHQLSVTWEASSFRDWTDAQGRKYVAWDAAFLSHLRRRAEDPRRRGGAGGAHAVTGANPLPEPKARVASSALPPTKPKVTDGA